MFFFFPKSPLQRSYTTPRPHKLLTIAPEYVNVQLLKEVHDEGVDLWQQPHEEDDGKTQSEDCRQTQKTTILLNVRRFIKDGDGSDDDRSPGAGCSLIT